MRATRSWCACFLVAVTGCGGPRSEKVSADGRASGIVRGGDQVAYLLNLGLMPGDTGELHVAGSHSGSDVRVASKVSVAGYMLSPDGRGLFFAQLNSDNADASLSFYDVKKGGAPRVLFAHGLKTAPNNPDDMMSPVHAETLANQYFTFTPSGKYLIAGVLAPNVAMSPDLHVLDAATGNDIFVRGNGAFDYNVIALPDDTLVFQDATGGNDGPTGPTPLLQLFSVKLGSGSTSPLAIDARAVRYLPTSDNKRIVYQRSDRQLFAWDATASSAATVPLAMSAVSFAVGTGSVVYSTGDGGIHVAGVDGSKKLDLPAVGADVNTPLYLSSDDRDVYYFQTAEPQNARGTLMHVATSGGMPAKLDEHVGLYDLQLLPGAILYLRNVDAKGLLGDVVKAARDGSHASLLGMGVPVAPLGPVVSQNTTPGGLAAVSAGGNWLAPHLIKSEMNTMQRLIDGGFATLGVLALATASGEMPVEPTTRAGDYVLADDNQTLIYIGGLKLDSKVDNYVGWLAWVPTAMPTMKPNVIALDAVSEISTVSKRGLFAVSNGKSSGVYFVTY